MGPFANKYNFWVKKTSTSSEGIKLIQTYPGNINPETETTDILTQGFEVNGKLTNGTGDSANVELGATMKFENTKWLKYKTNEYTIVNNSTQGNAIWAWDSKALEHLDNYLIQKTSPIWTKGNILKTDRFSAISRNSFTPSLQAVYQSGLNFNGKSSFEIGTNIETGSIEGFKYYYGLYYSYWAGFKGMTLEDINNTKVSETIDIDWSSPYFATETNIRLQDTSSIYNTKCLTAKNDNKVKLDDCSIYSRGLIWGYVPAEKQFKSRITNNSCLSANSDGTLDIKECSFDNNQKWELPSDGGIKSYSNGNYIIKNADGSIGLGKYSNQFNIVKFNAFATEFQ